MRKSCISIVFMALVFVCASPALAIFPSPDGEATFVMRQGWYEDSQAWYLNSNISTNDVNTARRLCTDIFSLLAPKLSSLLQPRELGGEIAARPMYIVLNPASTQGPVFSAAPGQTPPDVLYSGFWQVFYIQWNPGAVRRPITNATPGDPQGLPDASEASIVETGIVIQHPILAIGPLGGPWLPAPPGSYRIKQARVLANYAQTKVVKLPTYLVFCQDYVTRRVAQRAVVIPDAASIYLAEQIKANFALGLVNVPDGTIDPGENDTQALYFILCAPQRCQIPILEECHRGLCASQSNPDWTPVVRLIQLQRNIPFSTVVNNADYVELLLGNGGLVNVDDVNRMAIMLHLAPG